MRDFAGAEVFPHGQCAPRKVIARFRAQVVDFPHLQKGKMFGVGRLGPLGAASGKRAEEAKEGHEMTQRTQSRRESQPRSHERSHGSESSAYA